MVHGYSQRLIERNGQAGRHLTGVRLGQACIKHQVPVSAVAREFKVSRQTVYSWFTGVSNPPAPVRALMDAYIAKLS